MHEITTKSQLLKWINELVKVNITHIEQLGTGAIYCQIFDSVFRNKINMKKVNWEAKHDYEFLNNFKLLQQAFISCKIDKHIEVNKLVKAKYQDNLEFIQWFSKFYYQHKNHLEYDPLSSRKIKYPDFQFLLSKNDVALVKKVKKDENTAPLQKKVEQQNKVLEIQQQPFKSVDTNQEQSNQTTENLNSNTTGILTNQVKIPSQFSKYLNISNNENHDVSLKITSIQTVLKDHILNDQNIIEQIKHIVNDN